MSQLAIPTNYKPLLSVRETEHAIVMIKDFFQLALSTELNLTRVTAPLFVPKGTGLNDDLNGVERAVTFPVKDMGHDTGSVHQQQDGVEFLVEGRVIEIYLTGVHSPFLHYSHG